MMWANGANAFTVQQFLGHESMETTRIYAQMEQPDIERQHERASPVDRWGL